MTSQLHVIAGAGTVGSAAATLLAEQGHRVRILSRSGSGPVHPQIERVSADAGDGERLTQLADGASALYNCLNPAYHRWVTDWPPLASALLGAAERTGAVLATVSNLYVYGPPSGPMTEQTPMAATFTKGMVRAQMWRDALAAHEAGRVRVTEVRGSDYVGPHSQGQFSDRAVPKLLRGKAVSVLGRPDAPHTYTYTGDVARLLVTVASDDRAWGQAWHVPSHDPLTARQVVEGLCDVAGVPHVAVRRIPDLALTVGGLFAPMLREFAEVRYQHDQPFVMDSSAAQSTFGLAPTPWQGVLRATVEAHRPQARAAA